MPSLPVKQKLPLAKHIKPAPTNDFVFASSQSAPTATPQIIDNLNNPPPGVGTKWSWNLITIYDLRFTIYELRITNYELRITIYELRFTIYDLRITIYELRINKILLTL